MTDKFHVVISTCPDRSSADRIARRIIESRLAACVNVVGGVHSYYEWQNALEESDEFLLVIKSRIDVFNALQNVIISEHPYELPEVIAVPIKAGYAPYLAWLDANVRPNS
jgi:periplasmic divalent cation tolerance protein